MRPRERKSFSRPSDHSPSPSSHHSSYGGRGHTGGVGTKWRSSRYLLYLEIYLELISRGE